MERKEVNKESSFRKSQAHGRALALEKWFNYFWGRTCP